jgi:hypothetical protein
LIVMRPSRLLLEPGDRAELARILHGMELLS